MIDRRDSTDPATVVLVSSSSDLIRLTREFAADDGSIELHAVSDTDTALAFLDRRDSYVGAPRASLVLLDVREGVDGTEFLEAIVDEPTLAQIPVLVLGEPSQRQSDSNAGAGSTGTGVSQYYDRHANAFVPVPPDSEEVADVLRRIAMFWTATARLPNRDDRRR
ncbi:response regulator [Halosolutus halophilus]|uniref:response regulator n=1 Tax=Halosolutus halophilus TaxID=1552990 RepID=UPI0022351568|nr:response regulator [Halosolutus halophilus]